MYGVLLTVLQQVADFYDKILKLLFRNLFYFLQPLLKLIWTNTKVHKTHPKNLVGISFSANPDGELK